MKRALRVLDEPDDRNAADPIRVTLGGRVLSVEDAHDGVAAARFVSYLREAGATDAGKGSDPDLRIVIRSTPQSSEARLRSDLIEEQADLVLGAARASFARRLAGRAASQEKP